MSHGKIDKVDNRIQVGSTDEPYGGQVVDLQYSISFENPSSVALTIANAEGKYDISKENLNSEKSVLIEFGPFHMEMLPISYRTSKGSGGRTLTVNYEDMSLKYLDKNTILLKHHHLEEPRGGATLVMGVLFADDENGVSRRYMGDWIPGGVVKVQYDIRDVAEAIRDHDIPINQEFFDYLEQFKGYVKEDGLASLPSAFLRNEVGSIRSVLGAIASELGFVFFWNNEDGLKGRQKRPLHAESILNKKENEGFLDFIKFETTIDIDQINDVADEFSESCNVQDDSSEVSIKDSFLRGGVGYFSVMPPTVKGRTARFSRFRFQEKINSPYNFDDQEEPLKETIKGNYHLELLMRAAVMGPDFYKKYIMAKLTASYMADIADAGGVVEYLTLKRRDQPEDETLEIYDRLSKTITEGADQELPLNLEINDAVDNLYKGEEFDLIPSLYSRNWTRTEGDAEDWREYYKVGEYSPNGHPLNPMKDTDGSTADWLTIFQDEGFIKSLRGEFKYYDEDVDPSEFIGLLCKTTITVEGEGEEDDYVRETGLKKLLDNTENDKIYSELKFLSENYGSLYFQGTRVRGRLATQELYSRRNYSENTEFCFSDMAAFDSPVAAIFNYTQPEFKEDGTSIYERRGNYDIMKEGQSICGKPDDLPGNVLSPTDRVYTVGSDNENLYTTEEKDEEAHMGYKDIMGIYTFLGKKLSIIQAGDGNPKATGCNRGEDDEAEIETQYEVELHNAPVGGFDGKGVKGFKLETLRRRAYTEIQYGDPDDPLVEHLGGNGKSINSRQYQELQDYRTTCDEEIHPQEALTTPTTKSEETADTQAQFHYPTDRDYGVITHNAGRGTEVVGAESSFGFASYTSKNDTNIRDLKAGERSLVVLESVGWNDPDFRAHWGKKDTDYWDSQLVTGVKLNIDLNKIQDRKFITYSLSVDEYLQSLRAAYVADSSNTDIFEVISSIQIEDIPFDMGALLNLDEYGYEFPVCAEGDADEILVNLEDAVTNLMRIMKDYVEINANPSISRDFVVSGYGFKEKSDSVERLPTVYQGLESVGVQLTENGIQTTIKLGNKRRMRASAQLRAQMIAKGMSGASASRRAPNQVNNAFATAFKAKL